MEINIDGHTVLMDDADYTREFIDGRTWHVTEPRTKRYVIWKTTRGGARLDFKLHRLIIGAKPGQQVDHINGNGLDNRRENLRLATAAENARNAPARSGGSSRFKGVGWHKHAWRVRIRVGYKHITVGYFKNEIEAAFAYDMASLKHHGEFGWRNFLPLA